MTTFITVRGVTFEGTGGSLPLRELTSLYLVFKALEGDPLAIEILTNAKTVVHDADKKQIWPPVVLESVGEA